MQTGLLAEAIGMRVVYHDIEARLPLGNATPATTLTALLQEADVVTLHVPQTERTRLLIAAERLAQMKPDAVLINLARGHAVDLDALHVALGAHRLRGAAIDVFPTEPTSNAAVFESPLRELDNVILTPHVGGSTAEAQHNLGVEVSEKLRDYLTLGAVRGSVNLPEVSVGTLRSPARLVHIHRDQPGVMSAQRRAGSSRLQCVAAAPGDRRRLRRCGDRPEPAAGQRHARRGGGRRGNRARLHGARARLMPCKS
jgi:D-3-phosphoglycerate dehydrogenase